MDLNWTLYFDFDLDSVAEDQEFEKKDETFCARALQATEVYAESSLNSRVVAVLQAQTRVRVVQELVVRGVRWYKIVHGSTQGWVTANRMIRLDFAQC